MKKKQIKVVYTKYGLANFFGDYIEINSKLKNNKKLRDYVVKHELGHSDKFDLGHDFKIEWKIVPSLLLFVFSTPSVWIDFLPIQKKGEDIVYDLNLIILYLFLIVLLIITYKIFF